MANSNQKYILLDYTTSSSLVFYFMVKKAEARWCDTFFTTDVVSWYNKTDHVSHIKSGYTYQNRELKVPTETSSLQQDLLSGQEPLGESQGA
jgi:hypothetical protein